MRGNIFEKSHIFSNSIFNKPFVKKIHPSILFTRKWEGCRGVSDNWRHQRKDLERNATNYFVYCLGALTFFSKCLKKCRKIHHWRTKLFYCTFPVPLYNWTLFCKNARLTNVHQQSLEECLCWKYFIFYLYPYWFLAVPRQRIQLQQPRPRPRHRMIQVPEVWFYLVKLHKVMLGGRKS